MRTASLQTGGEYAVICTQDKDVHEYVTSANQTADGNDFCLYGVFFVVVITCLSPNITE